MFPRGGPNASLDHRSFSDPSILARIFDAMVAGLNWKPNRACTSAFVASSEPATWFHVSHVWTKVGSGWDSVLSMELAPRESRYG